MHHLSHRHVGASGQLGGDSLIRLILRTLWGRLTRSSRRSPPHLRIFPSARREGHMASRISTDEQNRMTASGSHRGAHGAVKAIEAVLGKTAGWTHPRVGRRVISHGGFFFFRRLYRLESFDTLFDDNPEPSAARATSNKCEVGMARKRVSAHLRSVWQQKPGVMHRYAKDTILKKLFPPILLRICVSVCELKKSQP